MDHKLRLDKHDEPADGMTTRMTVAEAARRIGVCSQTVRNLAHMGRLTWFWVNGTERPSGIVASSVSRFLTSPGNSGCRRPAKRTKGKCRV